MMIAPMTIVVQGVVPNGKTAKGKRRDRNAKVNPAVLCPVNAKGRPLMLIRKTVIWTPTRMRAIVGLPNATIAAVPAGTVMMIVDEGAVAETKTAMKMKTMARFPIMKRTTHFRTKMMDVIADAVEGIVIVTNGPVKGAVDVSV